MAQLPVPRMRRLYLGNQALQGLMGDGWGSHRYVTASSFRCAAFRTCHFPQPILVPLLLSLFFRLSRALASLRPGPFLMPRENTHKQDTTRTLMTSVEQ